jgi:hypothetical protein
MFNRYIGNTGRLIRVDDAEATRAGLAGASRGARAASGEAEAARASGGLGGLLGGLLPFGLEVGDIVLLLLFLFLFLESGDDEFLIILAFLAIGVIKR